MTKMRIEKITAGITILAVIVAGTWAIATRTIDSKKEAMDDQLKQLQGQVQELQNLDPSFAEAGSPTRDVQGTQLESSDYSLVFIALEDGDTVPQFIDVQYSQVGNIPSEMHTILVVQDPLGQFWSWGNVYPKLSKRIQVGIPEDSGATFHIGLLVTGQDFPINKPKRGLPNHAHFQSIEIRRE